MSRNSTNNDGASTINPSQPHTGLTLRSMQRANPQHLGNVDKLRVPFLYALLPRFLQKLAIKTWFLSFLRPKWQPRHLIILGSYIYKFKNGNNGRNLLDEQPNGSPVRLDQINVYLVTSSLIHEDYEAIDASELLKDSRLVRNDNYADATSSRIFCIATFRKKYYYACTNHEEALIWVNTLREASQESLTRSMGHATKDSYPSSWSYYDHLGMDLVNRKDRIRLRLQQSNLRELEMSQLTEGGPIPLGYYG